MWLVYLKIVNRILNCINLTKSSIKIAHLFEWEIAISHGNDPITISRATLKISNIH